MLNYIWSFLVVFSVGCAALLGNTEALSKAFVDSAADAVQLLLTLAGVICLWSGLMKIAERSGLTNLAARLFAPLLSRLFPHMNITANLLGLGNTATPPGLKAMRELHALNGKSDTASDEMVLFVVMNTASLQLLPATLGALRQSTGSAAPFEILVPVWISSACALAVGLSLALAGNRLKRRSLCPSSCPSLR